MEIILLIISILILACLIYLLLRKPGGQKLDMSEITERLIKLQGSTEGLDRKLSEEFRNNRKELSENFTTIGKSLDTRVREMRDTNEKKLEEMRETVDEKLKSSVEKRFNESFSVISKQLTDVYKGLGEMKDLASGVGDLKKVMEGVKTRGIYGEVQLGAIISDILPITQYAENIITKKGTNDRVEFAIKLPGKEGDLVYLPIDSKFPIENYQRLLTAYDKGDKDSIEKSRKALTTDVKEQAKKISSKYIDPPHTTNYAMMFLPTESLYAEVYRIPGLAEEIRRKENIVIVSPSTLPMVLNGLLTGFKTLAIEKRSAEVWNTLAAAKTEFGKFGDLLDGVQKKLEEGAKKIETAKKSSKKIEKTLEDVETLDEGTTPPLLS